MRGGQHQRVEIARDRSGDLRAARRCARPCSPCRMRARHELARQGRRASRAADRARVRGDVVSSAARSASRRSSRLPSACSHATEDGVARGAVGGERRRHRPALLPDLLTTALSSPCMCRRTNASRRATPSRIASGDAAYEKRMCWPSPGTRRPKWMSASTATPASCSSRLRNASESAQPVIAQASVTFGQA